MTTLVNVDVMCNYCNKNYPLKVDKQGYSDWKNGAGFIQDLLPKSSAADRELLISATCDDCWHKMFPGDDADEDS